MSISNPNLNGQKTIQPDVYMRSMNNVHKMNEDAIRTMLFTTPSYLSSMANQIQSIMAVTRINIMFTGFEASI